MNLKLHSRIAAIAVAVVVSLSAMNPTDSQATEIATLGGGCFWCFEAVYARVDGVKSVISGYAGGHKENPTYKEVCEETTGHAEVVQIEYDPSEVSFEQLLTVFWKAHDPTTLNRQGADVGTRYRSIILHHSDSQKEIAEKSMAEANKEFKGKIVTQIEPLKKFYQAEAYHQEYFENNSNQSYCRFVILPKLNKLQKDKVINED